MRILVVHNLKHGGGWRRLSEQVAHLDAEIIELTLATATPVTDSPRLVPYTPRAPYVRPALRPPLRYSDAGRLALAWRRLAREATDLRPDVIFANSCQFLNAPPVLLSTAIPSLFLCDEPRRVDYEPEVAATRRRRTRAVYAPIYFCERLLDAASVRHASTLAANSVYAAGRLRAAYDVPATVIPMGVSESFRHGTLDRHREDLVLSVGMLTPGKGHDLVIRAASRSRCLKRVVIVSPRPAPEEEQRLRSLAAAVDVTIEIRIGITDVDLRGEYERARVTAYLARGEPFGLAALEAQACGCPVVVSAEGGLPETMIDGVTGFAVPRDPDAAARAIDRLCQPETARTAQAAAADHGRAWSWAVSAARVQGLLEDVLSGRRR